MIEYVHSSLGRLRVQLPLFRRKPRIATGVEATIAAIEGVTSVSANTVTGSVIITYDHRALSAAELWEELARLGYVERSPAPPASPSSSDSFGTLPEHLVDFFGRAFLQVLAERSATALFRGLI
ncbi:heavy-metal-associated domain-containing protein [Inquilinus limosus]|uniref:HMA2 domain-containing protein n=1 Tax=Inquilinus limosus TaxID=171674 RepID=UPI003F156446